MITLLTAPMCLGCHKIAETLTARGADFVERDIRSLSEVEIVDLLVALRASGWAEKLVYVPVGDDMKPVLQAPIITDWHGALCASRLLPDGKTPSIDALEVAGL